jgi:hypothetical protein
MYFSYNELIENLFPLVSPVFAYFALSKTSEGCQRDEEGEGDFKREEVGNDSLCLFFHSLKQPIKFINNSIVRQ